ncbi:MAG: hypothetical protein ACLP01_23380 [Solirubrobacteraceae bacterium]
MRDEPSWAPAVHVHATSNGQDAGRFVPGTDLVLAAPIQQGQSLADGVLLDDWLSQDVRVAIDSEAVQRLARWRAAVDQSLTVDGIPIAEIWEIEALCDVFLPATRIVRGLAYTFAERRPEQLVLHGVPNSIVRALNALEIELRQVVTPLPSASGPSQAELSWRISPLRRRATQLFALIGIPGRPRGEVVLFPYWHLTPVFIELLENGPLPLLHPGRTPAVSRSALARAFARGGWLPYASGKERRRSRRELAQAIADARGPAGAMQDALAVATHEQTLDELARRAGDTLAVTRSLTRGLRDTRLLVLPFDATFDARMFVHAARVARVPTLVVQHGFHCEPNTPDKHLADHVAVWSKRDLRQLEGRIRGTLSVTGNPGASARARAAARSARRDCTLILVQDPSRSTIRTDVRVSMQHARVALRALGRARPGTRAILRPHPSDPNSDAYLELAREVPAIDTAVETASPIERLIANVDLCVGAVSTASLQAGASGVPVVLLNVDRSSHEWPFDGEMIPVAYDEDQLADLIARLLATDVVPGVGAMVEALGMRPDALERTVELIRGLVADQPISSPPSSP